MIQQSYLQQEHAYQMVLHRPYGDIDEILAWCKSECQSSWAWEINTFSSPWQRGEYVFYFASSRDCFAFAVKWT